MIHFVTLSKVENNEKLWITTELVEGMGLDKETKESVIAEYQLKEGDTGSTEVQVALLTSRIQRLTEHLQSHRHDESTRRGLLTLVGKRRKLLSYLNAQDVSRYRSLISRAGLRR